MSLNDEAPQFFAAALGGVAAEGPNVMLSFITFVPSDDHKDRKYCTNVRVVMSSDSVTQMVEFLTKLKAEAADTRAMHPMPETKQ